MQQIRRPFCRFITAALCIALTNCAGRHDSTSFLPRQTSLESLPAISVTNYRLPRDSSVWNFTHGAYGTLWTVDAGQPYVYRLNTTSGRITTLAVPSPYQPESAGFIVAASRGVWFFAFTYSTHEVFLIGITPEGAFKVFDLGLRNVQIDPGLAVAPNGKLWFSYTTCIPQCGSAGNYSWLVSVSTTGTLGPKLRLSDYFVSGNLTAGPDGNMYVTAIWSGQGTPPATDSCVFVVSPTGLLLHRFFLANHSYPQAIAAGPDGNIWITETNANKIARMTTGGRVTEFTIPTAAANPNAIISGNVDTLWFNEVGKNKIARITTSGGITEYQLPNTSGSFATVAAFATCTTACAPNDGVWLLDHFNAYNAIAKFVL
jgi:virginiamycin B lyase